MLADFFNYLAVAWFTGGIVTPFFVQPDSIFQSLRFPLTGIAFTVIFLFLSLTAIREIKS